MLGAAPIGTRWQDRLTRNGMRDVHLKGDVGEQIQLHEARRPFWKAEHELRGRNG
ncbi:MAG: hypothetical protein V4530_06255 [Pseudomonadota bacterium]